MPSDINQTVYLVLDDFGEAGWFWQETAAVQADLETVITDLMSVQYRDPLRVIAFNVSDQSVSEVSADIAQELQRRPDINFNDLTIGARLLRCPAYWPGSAACIEADLMS